MIWTISLTFEPLLKKRKEARKKRIEKKTFLAATCVYSKIVSAERGNPPIFWTAQTYFVVLFAFWLEKMNSFHTMNFKKKPDFVDLG